LFYLASQTEGSRTSTSNRSQTGLNASGFQTGFGGHFREDLAAAGLFEGGGRGGRRFAIVMEGRPMDCGRPDFDGTIADKGRKGPPAGSWKLTAFVFFAFGLPYC